MTLATSRDPYERRLVAWCQRHEVSVDDFRFRPGSRPATTRGVLLKPRRRVTGVVVFAHGTGCDALFPQALLFRGLLARGIAVMGFDLEGHGRDNETVLNRSGTDGGVAAAVAAVVQRLPGTAVHLAGYSLGAVCAARSLAETRLPPEVRSFVPIACPTDLTLTAAALVGEALAPLRRSFWEHVRASGWWASLPAVGPFRRGRYPVRFALEPGESYVGFVDSFIQHVGVEAALAQLQVPMKMVYAEHDHLVPPSTVRPSWGVNPMIETITIPGENHFTLLLCSDVVDTVTRALVGHVGSMGRV